MKLIEVLGEAAAMVVRGMSGKASHEQNFKKSSCRDPVGALYTAPQKARSLWANCCWASLSSGAKRTEPSYLSLGRLKGALGDLRDDKGHLEEPFWGLCRV